jgi:hypothetical protein
MTIIDLLWDDAAALAEIKKSYTATYTKEEYLEFWRSFVGGEK